MDIKHVAPCALCIVCFFVSELVVPAVTIHMLYFILVSALSHKMAYVTLDTCMTNVYFRMSVYCKSRGI